MEKIIVNDFTLKQIHYHFNKPIRLNVKIVDKNMYYAYDKIFDIFVYEDLLENVESEYQRDFAELYEAFALEDDENLDKGARQLKRKFLKYCIISKEEE